MAPNNEAQKDHRIKTQCTAPTCLIKANSQDGPILASLRLKLWRMAHDNKAKHRCGSTVLTSDIQANPVLWHPETRFSRNF